MSRTPRLVVIAAAWVIPFAWVAVALFSGPSDGTTISPPTVLLDADRWGETATVNRTYGDTPLREGDVIQRIDGTPFAEWVSTGPDSEHAVGDVVRYEVRRPAAQLDRILELDVTLTRYPLADAVRDNVATVLLVLMLLVAGTVAFWHRPRDLAAGVFLATCALVPAAVTAYPLGLDTLDVGGGQQVYPHLVGEVLAALGLGTALVAAVVLVPVPDWRRHHRWAWFAPCLAPLLGYLAWLLVAVPRQDLPATRLQLSIAVVGPALVATAPAFVAALVHDYRRATGRPDRLAARLVLLATAGAVGAWLLLLAAPQRVTGEAIVPPSLLTVLLAPAFLSCVVVAILRYHLDDVEVTVRRALLQAAVAALVGTAFVAAAVGVDVASDSSFESMVAGGAIALLVLPVALGLNRLVRRLVYGDREFPRRIVSELRRLDPLTAPVDALQDTLALLGQRLRLSYAAIEIFGSSAFDPFETSVGTRRGPPTTIELEVGGSRIGRLLLEVDPSRDPFGPGDRRLLEDVGSQVGALVQAVSINRELQRSRQRLITTREEERRRIRRDLHDGLGPSLATLALRLEAARDLVAEDPAGAADLMDELAERARTEIGEVRRLVHGLRPAALDQLGLVSALRLRAEEHNLAADARDGEHLRWRVSAESDLDPLPAAVEVAAYHIVLEAVNNAARHSGARDSCAVTLRRGPGELRVEIRDTGAGMDPNPRLGLGLTSMQERTDELGGSCTLTSAPGVGTVVDVRIPVGTEPPDDSRT